MAASSASAGPSKAGGSSRRRRSSDDSAGSSTKEPPAKLSRIDDEPDTDMGGAGVDPMEALDNSAANGSEHVDPMEGLEKQVQDVDVPAPAIVRADEFEQEAERVVEAAKGLDGGAGDEGQVKLVHQVRHQVRLIPWSWVW